MAMQARRNYLAIILFLCTKAYSDPLIKIAVIDTGVDTKKYEIQQVLCPDSEGLDVTTGKEGLPPDTIGHGTHVTGIIRALAGFKGYCIAPCKYYSPNLTGDQNKNNTVTCFKHAKEIGAAYINYSSGGQGFDEYEKLAIADLKDVKVFVAAGNDHVDLDLPGNKNYPASYMLPNVISVGALDARGNRTPSSNWGQNTVTLFTLGESVYSPTHEGMAYMTGTSMATAVALGTELRKKLGLPDIGDYKAYNKHFLIFWRGY